MDGGAKHLGGAGENGKPVGGEVSPRGGEQPSEDRLAEVPGGASATPEGDEYTEEVASYAPGKPLERAPVLDGRLRPYTLSFLLPPRSMLMMKLPPPSAS